MRGSSYPLIDEAGLASCSQVITIWTRGFESQTETGRCSEYMSPFRCLKTYNTQEASVRAKTSLNVSTVLMTFTKRAGENVYSSRMEFALAQIPLEVEVGLGLK